MRFFSWLFARNNPHLNDAIRDSDDLTEGKRRLTQFTRELEAGQINGEQKVLHLRRNVLEQALLNDRLSGRKDRL